MRGRIGGERARWLRLVAGRMFDQGKLLGALLLLDEVGGSLQEQADRAVLGALDEAQRATQDRDGIAARVFAVSKEQQAAVDALAEQHAAGPARLEAGRKLAKDKSQRAVARELIRTLEFTPALREEAKLAREQIERDWLADVPPEERAEADAARNHPSWARTGQRVSHRFVLIGPQTLLDGIPDDSLLRFDLAYLYLTDLFGRVPNPDGDRVTVYWKELWDFGGGVGGGKIIDIGNADPSQKAMRVDNGLLYHELTHCIDDTTPVYGGLREGLADFGAAFAQMELGQVAGGRAAMGIAARAFLQDYVERDLEYWRIPNYGPSAGFLLHFVTQYGKSGTGYRWELYRKFFRDYRGCRVKDGRTPTLARAFAFHLVEAFGEAAFADLIRFRWPLQPGDLAAIRAEQRASQRPADGPDLAEFDGSPVPRDRKARELRREQATLDEWAPQLGVVRDWWVIGPFRKDGLDPDTYRWAPEREVDLKARYESFNNNPTWRRPGQKPVTVDATGWLHFEFSYQDNSAIYALTHVRLEQETTIWVHVRGDDDITLFVDDELIGKHDRAGGPYGPWRPGWQTLLPDAASFPVDARQGPSQAAAEGAQRRRWRRLQRRDRQPQRHAAARLEHRRRAARETEQRHRGARRPQVAAALPRPLRQRRHAQEARRRGRHLAHAQRCARGCRDRARCRVAQVHRSPRLPEGLAVEPRVAAGEGHRTARRVPARARTARGQPAAEARRDRAGRRAARCAVGLDAAARTGRPAGARTSRALRPTHLQQRPGAVRDRRQEAGRAGARVLRAALHGAARRPGTVPPGAAATDPRAASDRGRDLGACPAHRGHRIAWAGAHAVIDPATAPSATTRQPAPSQRLREVTPSAPHHSAEPSSPPSP